MLDVKKLYPDCVESYGYGPGEWWSGPSSYQPIIDAIGNVLAQEEDHDYQGDTFVLYGGDINYRGAGSVYGILVIGWGSCSGCDSLQACDSYGELQSLADRLESSVQWLSVDELREWIKGDEARNDWYQWSDEDKAYWRFKKVLCEKFGVEYVGPRGYC